MDKYAVVGNPVNHSLSPSLHQAFAKQAGLDIEYRAITAPLHEFKQTILDLQKQGFKGCNITAPFKAEAYALSTAHSLAANRARTVNCLTFSDPATIFGDNFDGEGLIKDLSKRHHFSLAHKKILILGAGGAVSGIIGPLLEAAPKEILILNRTLEKALALAARFSMDGPIRGASITQTLTEPYDLIIHATSLGHPQNSFEFPDGALHKTTFCFDLSYGAAAKSFLAAAKKKGATHYADGMGMLIEQAAASFYRWHGIYPKTHLIDVNKL